VGIEIVLHQHDLSLKDRVPRFCQANAILLDIADIIHFFHRRYSCFYSSTFREWTTRLPHMRAPQISGLMPKLGRTMQRGVLTKSETVTSLVGDSYKAAAAGVQSRRHAQSKSVQVNYQVAPFQLSDRAFSAEHIQGGV
jgi:hypothetical protein